VTKPVLVILLLPAVALAINQPDLGTINGPTGRSLFGSGQGVRIGVLDGGIDAAHPALKGSISLQKDFSNSGTFDDATRGPGHATGIAGVYIGHASDFTGLAPSAQIINARVITALDSTSDRMAGNGLFYAATNGAKVINLSFGNRAGDGPLTHRFTLMVDYTAEIYGASIVTAGGNEDDTAVNQVPAGAFNAYAIGALEYSQFNRVAGFSNFALSKDRRTKPDLVAPGEDVALLRADWEKANDYYLGSGTSFATPMAGGVLAQMVGYGQQRSLDTRAMTLKAILMTSATKVYDNDGTPWAARESRTGKNGRIFTVPLDDEQGAGRIDAAAAFRIYSKTTDQSTSKANWASGRIRRGNTFTLDLGNLNAGQRVDSTLTWLRHVGRTDDGDKVLDADDSFYQTVPLADFVLRLVRNGKAVAASDTDGDTLEHLSFIIGSGGRYQLQAYRYTDGGIKSEPFAIAARVLNNPPILKSIGADPQSFGASDQGVMRGISVPEPALGSLALLAMLAFKRPRRR
jgi:subtilisin family serine protease